jgi:hypothetical protein
MDAIVMINDKIVYLRYRISIRSHSREIGNPIFPMTFGFTFSTE